MRTREESIHYLEQEFDIGEFASPIKTYFKPWQDELVDELKEQKESVKNTLQLFLDCERVDTVSLGRSRLVTLNTGVRLMHLGYLLFEVGHPYTPALGDGRYKGILYAVSGSGKTRFVTNAAGIAKENHVPVIAITSNPDSTLASLATEKIVTKGKKIYPPGSPVPSELEEPINFLQTKSEFKAFCIGELIVNCLAKMKGVTEADMKKFHANTE
jgi:6-phospho-3-hexuloisomerase